MSEFSFCITAFGVLEGVKSPNHNFASIPASPASAAPGTSGIPGKRSCVDTTKAFNLPDFSCAAAVTGDKNETWVSFARSAVRPAPALL